jgi:hypothetical protein
MTTIMQYTEKTKIGLVLICEPAVIIMTCSNINKRAHALDVDGPYIGCIKHLPKHTPRYRPNQIHASLETLSNTCPSARHES